MKLNIEELAREAGMDTEASYSARWECTTEDLEAFARRIVERCAQEADAMDDSDWSPAQVAAVIRNLMED